MEKYNSPAEISEAIEHDSMEIGSKPELMLVLGSGCGGVADSIEKEKVIPYENLTGMPRTTVKGHDGELILGKYENKDVIAFNGRNHFYEGNSAQDCSYMVHLASNVGAKASIMTSAVGIAPEKEGWIKKSLRKIGMDIENKYPAEEGDIMIIDTYEPNNLPSSLRGPINGGNRFPGTMDVPSIFLSELAEKVGKEQGFTLDSCCYVPRQGPSYETPAEVSLLSEMSGRLGMPVVGGMSLVPELEAAAYSNMSVLALGVVTNQMFDVRDKDKIRKEARGHFANKEDYDLKAANSFVGSLISSKTPDHEEVADVAESDEVIGKLEKIVSGVVSNLNF